jgi:hypothetical protein
MRCQSPKPAPPVLTGDPMPRRCLSHAHSVPLVHASEQQNIQKLPRTLQLPTLSPEITPQRDVSGSAGSRRHFERCKSCSTPLHRQTVSIPEDFVARLRHSHLRAKSPKRSPWWPHLDNFKKVSLQCLLEVLYDSFSCVTLAL